MTIDEFLAALAETRDKFAWEIDGYGGIRARKTRDGEYRQHICCPVTATVEMRTGRKKKIWYPVTAAKRLGLGVRDAKSIVKAADNQPGFEALRQRLLAAVGLGPLDILIDRACGVENS